MKRLSAVFLAVLMLAAAMPSSFAAGENGDLSLSCASSILMEKETGTVLYEQDAHAKLEPASVTKVMTLLLVMEAVDSGRIYLCKDYEIIIQTLEAGDLDETIRTLSGYDRDSLTVMKTRVEGADRYDFVWATAGENGERLGRAVILDDGNYHYTMTVLKDAEATKKTQVVWRTVFESFSLV